MAQRLQIQTPGICDDACIKKLKDLLAQVYTLTEIQNPPDHIKLKAELRKVGLPREVHLEVFVNSNAAITASPEVASFPQISTEIQGILGEAVKIVNRTNSIRVARARRVKEYIAGLSVDDEIQRMVIVALCDIVLDLMVTERLSGFTRNNADLENDSVGSKIGLLEGRYNVRVYKSKVIRDVRELRNKIAHGGTAPAIADAVCSRDETFDIFNTL